MREWNEIMHKIKRFRLRKAYKNFKIWLKKKFSFLTVAKKNVTYAMVKKEKSKNEKYKKKYKKAIKSYDEQKEKIQNLQDEINLLNKRTKNLENIENKKDGNLQRVMEENKKLKEENAKLQEKIQNEKGR